MNLYNIWVSLSEMSNKNIDLFHDIQIFWDVPVNKQFFMLGYTIPLTQVYPSHTHIYIPILLLVTTYCHNKSVTFRTYA